MPQWGLVWFHFSPLPVSVVITGLGPDFTKIESFGKVDEFAETLVSGLDRSWQRPPGVEAKLINSKSSNGFYYIEYTLQRPGETHRYLFSALGMASNGWINRLYTITGQVFINAQDFVLIRWGSGGERLLIDGSLAGSLLCFLNYMNTQTKFNLCRVAFILLMHIKFTGVAVLKGFTLDKWFCG
ncbi:psbP domain-containing protein 3, chloroplastic-like [Humulus lupulus]|uniref:psbP domain-containing protein 3, chloroplastic-like n=1 Tax=Humulus lupulus TaxID=3486 RepID=UPI002B417679|nr:psbP domain-containing protein 3, chloroplastic-like [Humulus lupulus]